MPIKRRFSAAGAGSGTTQAIETHPRFGSVTVNNGSTWQTVGTWTPTRNDNIDQLVNDSGSLKELSFSGSFTVGASAINGNGNWRITRDGVAVSSTVTIRTVSTALTLAFSCPVEDLGKPNAIAFQYSSGGGTNTDGATINDLAVTGRYEEE